MVQIAPEKWQAALAHVPLHFIHNQSVVNLEDRTCPPSSVATFANGKMQCQVCVVWGKRFQWRRVLLLSIYFIPRSVQRDAFFLTVEGQKEGSARSTIRLLSCTNTLAVQTRPSHHEVCAQSVHLPPQLAFSIADQIYVGLVMS